MIKLILALVLTATTAAALLFVTDNILGEHSEASLSNVEQTPIEDMTRLDWTQIEQAFTQVAESRVQREYVIGQIRSSSSPASIYVKAMLRLGAADVMEAERIFATISLSDIPDVYLYAPFRTEEFLGRSENRYLAPLVAALDKNVLPALVSARLSARTGQLETALEYYLSTDPGRWTTYDVDSFRLMIFHTGIGTDTKRMLSGAINSGRPADNIRELIINTLFRPGVPAAIASSNQTGEQTAKEMIRLRTDFVQRRFAAILSQYQDRNPSTVGNEVTLLLFVSALAVENKTQADVWSLELKRRFPDEETRLWIAGLING